MWDFLLHAPFLIYLLVIVKLCIAFMLFGLTFVILLIISIFSAVRARFRAELENALDLENYEIEIPQEGGKE